MLRTQLHLKWKKKREYLNYFKLRIMKQIIVFTVLLLQVLGFSQAESKANKFNSFSNNGGDVWICGTYLLAGGHFYTPTTVNIKWGKVAAINKTLTKNKTACFVIKMKYYGGNESIFYWLSEPDFIAGAQFTTITQSKNNPCGECDQYELVGRSIKSL